ncbi:MAG: hypothetical protein ACI3XL_04885 [Eubacteriales bacterium]
MFTNKNKLIGFIALIVVVVLVASTAIALIADNANKKAVAEAEKRIEELKEQLAQAGADLDAAESSIKTLETALDNLKSELQSTGADLDAAEEKIQKYEDLIAAWVAATPLVREKIDELYVIYYEATANYVLLTDETIEALQNALVDAQYAIIRSADLDAVVEGFQATVNEIRKDSIDSVLQAMIDAVEADGVTYPDDVEGVAAVKEYIRPYLESEDHRIYDALEEVGVLDNARALEEALIAAEANYLVDKFVAAVEAIETPITLESDVAAAVAAWEELCVMGSHVSDPLNREEVVAARATLDTYEARYAVLEAAKVEADGLNAQIEALSASVGASVATKTSIETLLADIEAWVAAYEIDEANRPMVNDTADLEAAFEAAVEALRAEYEAFKAAVEAIGEVTHESGAVLEAANAAYVAVSNKADADVLLALETPNTVGELYGKLCAAQAEYDAIVALISSIRAEIDRLYDADPNVTHEEVAALNALVEQLVADFDITVINTETVDYVARLAVVRLIPSKNDALANIHAIYNEYYAANEAGSRDVLVRLANSYAAQKAHVNSLTSLDEIESCGADAYIRGLFDAAINNTEEK